MELFQEAAFEDAMPLVLQTDGTLARLGTMLGQQLREINAETEKTIIWARIDELDEELLDILAYDLHIDWWKYATTIESKRENLRKAVFIHKFMGTKAACQMAAEICVSSPATIKEWYEYGGSPGYFRIYIASNKILRTTEGMRDLIELIWIVKRCSAWLEEMVIELDMGTVPVYMGGVMGTIARTFLPEVPDSPDFLHTLYMGGTMGGKVGRDMPEVPDRYDFRHSLYAGGTMGAGSAVTVGEGTGAAMGHTSRAGGSGGTITTLSIPELS